MILDSSVLTAIILQEAGYEDLVLKLVASRGAAVGAPTLAETGIVLTRRLDVDSITVLSRFLDDFEVRLIPFGDGHWQRAIDAFQRFGKGRHPAGLNLGDCNTYSIAAVAKQPLFFRGIDFTKTDLTPA